MIRKYEDIQKSVKYEVDNIKKNEEDQTIIELLEKLNQQVKEYCH